MLVLLEKFFKVVFILSLLATVSLYWGKDNLPPVSFYDLDSLNDPLQQPTSQDSFTVSVDGETYRIKPKFDYELDGVIVSYHDADDFSDVWHHSRWQDFINLRDICVVWGKNVATGVYLDMDFHNDSWTCWAAWPNAEVGQRFQKAQLSNNHVLIDDEAIRNELMKSEPGDHIRLKGMLVEYSNPRSGFYRSTSTIRDDTGNGACETIYATDFTIIKKANQQLRLIYSIVKWSAIISLVGFVIFFLVTPYKGRYA